MWIFKPYKKAALVLSGGSARGVTHLGVVKVFKREGLKFDMVVGTSIGSLIGAAYCLDLPLEEVEATAVKTTAMDLLDITISRMGLTEGNKLENIIRRVIKNKSFNDLKIPLAITTVDIETGNELYFTSGDLARIIKASCSLPGIFKPIEIGGRLMIDGGMKQHLPVAIAKKLGADFIVAVDAGFCVKKGKINNMLGILMQSIQIMGEELARHQSVHADIIIKPQLGDTIDQMAFNKAAVIIKKGEEAAEEALPILKKYIKTET
ncbi:MAG: patatin-like phospholipase family protein [Candidatus Omnitrophica bacterium]|nr:patatin-like phospholipase family protein [Candidatus Omnitrophota bacterium]